MKGITSLLLLSVVLPIFAQRISHPDCSTGFKYIYMNKKVGWVGLGFAWTSQTDLLHNVTMHMDFATAELSDTTYLGSLQILRFHKLRTATGDDRWNVIYEVIFPTQDPLPDVTLVILNGVTLCNDSAKVHVEPKPDLVKLRLRYNDFLKEQSFTSELVKKPTEPLLPLSNPNAVDTQNTGDDRHSILGCGKTDLSNIYVPLILDGSTIQRGTWPWLVSVYSYSKLRLGFRCGATLISRKLVVTAAHCFYDIYNRQVKTEDVLIILGQYNLKRPNDIGSQIVYPESVNIHPNYRKRNSADSDIAVVVLADPIRFTTYIRPACLWNETDSKQSIVGQIGASAGWGRDENGNFFTELPKQVEIPVVSDETCLRSNVAFPKITTEETFCAGWRNGTDGPCNGDSGGPLVFERDGRWTLRGVVSTSLSTDGSNTCNLNEYVVFTDVAKFRDWILTFSDDSYEF